MVRFASRIGLCLLVLAVFLASALTPARAEAITINENTVMSPVNFGILVSCAAGGAGEMVNFTGNFLNTHSLTISDSGQIHYRFSTLAQNVVGVGQVTGDRYVYSGGVTESGVLSMGEIGTASYDSRVIGQGAGNNFIAHTVIHYTFNTNGEMVVDFVITGASCN